MKILFLEVHHEREWAVASIGPAFLASFVRAANHEAELLHVTLDMSEEEIATAVQACAPDILGLSLTSRQWLRARSVVAALRQRVDIPVITGGLHPTFAPIRVLESPGFDYVCLGEGEEALVDVLDVLQSGKRIEDSNLPNIYCQGGTRPRLRPPFEPIDSLPNMARDMLNERHGVTHMVTQRGCPFPCTYCAARKFHDLYGGIGSYGRRRSHQNVLDEIETLADTSNVSYITFLDDTFTLSPSWVSEFCAQYEEQFSIPFSLHARAETVNPKMLAELANAGCKHITYGVESGSERVRKDIMKRIVSNEHLLQVFRQTQEEGILVTANYILGTPGETCEEIQQTIDLHHQLKPDDFGYFVFYPYPGTAMFHTCQEKGYLPDDYWERPANHRETILNLPCGVTKEDITRFYEAFTKVREESYLNRFGQTMNPTDKSTLHTQHHESAQQG